MIDHINICDDLLKRKEIEPFLKRVITGDEKLLTYDNPNKMMQSLKKSSKIGVSAVSILVGAKH